MTSPPDSFRALYDPEGFRAQAREAADMLADHLAASTSPDRSAPVLAWRDPADMRDAWPDTFPAQPDDTLVPLLRKVVADSIHQHHPRCAGYQVSAPIPAAAVADLAASLLNNGMASYDSGPASTVLERHAVQWMAKTLGMGPEADGVLTSGGTLGNLTALLAARQAILGKDTWREGTDGTKLAVLSSDQAHYCVARAAGIMGLGEAGVVSVPTDADLRLRGDAVAEGLAEAKRRGRKPFAVVASSGTTPTGTFDPLPEIAKVCREHGVWLHIDGAHGAAAAMSPRHRHLIEGLELADSVVWDAHKMLHMPALCTGVLFREGSRSYDVFEQRASYLFAPGDSREQWYNMAIRTVECTKTMMALKLYAILATVGTQTLSDLVEYTFDLGAAFAKRLRAAGFEVPTEPSCNIVCFRHGPVDAEDGDAQQLRIREEILREGAQFVSRTKLRDRIFLRTTLMNPLTTGADLDAMVARLAQAASGN